MKKLLGIVVLSLLWINTSFASEIFLSCLHQTGSSIVLSFDKTKNIGKEYIGDDTQITYDLVVSDGVIYFSSEKRIWTIDRFTGVSNLSSKNSDGSFLNAKWICNKAAEKKF